jgi:hypothetical protein
MNALPSKRQTRMRGSRRVVLTRAVVRVAMTLLVLLAGPAAARAQQPTTAPELPPEQVTSGWVFTPSVAFGVMHDDNPLLSAHGDPSPGDTVTVVRPGVNVTLTRKHTVFGAEYHGSLQRYNTLDQYDAYDQGGRIELRHQPTRRLRLSGNASVYASPTTELVEVAGVPFQRTGTRSENVVAGAIFTPTLRLELSGNYVYQHLQFDHPDPLLADILKGGRAHQVQLAARQRVSERLRVGGTWSIQRATVGQFASTFVIQDAEGVVEYELAPNTTLEGGLGVSYLSLSVPSIASQTGPAGHISLTHRTEYALFSVAATRSAVPAFGFGGTFQNSQVVGSVYFPFARRRAYVESNVAWRDSQPVLESGLNLRSFWVRGILGYSVQRWLRIEGFYMSASQDTTLVAGGQIDRHRIGIQLVTSHPMRID